MENVADALKLAGSVLLFVLALSIAVLSFSTAREAIDIRLRYADRESSTVENNSNFYYLSNEADTNRYVGKETIIPAIYRAYKENFKIVFKFPDDYYLFMQKDNLTGIINKEITTLDLSKQSLSSDLASRDFLDGMIYGKFDYATSTTKQKIEYERRFGIRLNSDYLYNYLTEKEKNYKIKESLGTYYTDDIGVGTTNPQIVTDNNKNEKRVITYEFIPK